MTSSEAIANHLPSGENSFLTFQLPHRIRYTSNVYIKVESIQVPISWYSIDDDNDALNISVNGTPQSMTLTHGNYDMYQIADMITAALTTYNVTVSYNESTNKLLFTYTGIGNLIIYPTSTCYILLGLSSGVTYTGTSISSTNICDTTRVMRLMVVTPSFQVTNYTSNSVPYAGLLAGIPVNNIYNSILDYRGNDEMFTPSREFYQLTIQLLDESMGPIDLNGATWTMSISFITYE